MSAPCCKNSHRASISKHFPADLLVKQIMVQEVYNQEYLLVKAFHKSLQGSQTTTHDHAACSHNPTTMAESQSPGLHMNSEHECSLSNTHPPVFPCSTCDESQLATLTEIVRWTKSREAESARVKDSDLGTTQSAPVDENDDSQNLPKREHPDNTALDSTHESSISSCKLYCATMNACLSVSLKWCYLIQLGREINCSEVPTVLYC